jgi:hypothetical protein
MSNCPARVYSNLYINWNWLHTWVILAQNKYCKAWLKAIKLTRVKFCLFPFCLIPNWPFPNLPHSHFALCPFRLFSPSLILDSSSYEFEKGKGDMGRQRLASRVNSINLPKNLSCTVSHFKLAGWTSLEKHYDTIQTCWMTVSIWKFRCFLNVINLEMRKLQMSLLFLKGRPPIGLFGSSKYVPSTPLVCFWGIIQRIT